MRKVITLVLLLLLYMYSTGYTQDKPYRILNSFSAGELSELLIAREDLSKYHSGCSVMENMFPLPQGGAQKRPGTIYVAESKENTKIRLISFEYSTEQSYISELGNQYARFYTKNAQISGPMGTEDVSSVGSVVAHWLLNDNLATTAVLDNDGGTHNGVATANTNVLFRTGKTGTGCFYLDTQYAVEVADHNDFTFDDSNDEPFSIAAWIYVTSSGIEQSILSKWDSSNKREWGFAVTNTKFLYFVAYDESVDKFAKRQADDIMTDGWHFVTTVYDNADAAWSGASAANFMTFYVDGAAVDSTATNDSSYVAMENLTSGTVIGGLYATGSLTYFFKNKIDNVALFSKALSTAEVTTLHNSTTYEVPTPYLTADLFELKFEQSADVLYITHPDYEPRKLSRLANTNWILEPLALESGPFRSQNIDTSAMIAASATTGSVTLTATGCNPFVSGTTAGHLPSGAADTGKSQTGALFNLVHPVGSLAYTTQLEDNYTDDQTENISWLDCGTVYKGVTWNLLTTGTWGATLEVQRNYTIGAAHDASGWEKVFGFGSIDSANTNTSGTEEYDSASYRVILITTGDSAETCVVHFRTDAVDHVGIVKITAVTNSTSATATVLRTLGSTDTTHKWSEGSWSNYRGWPRAVTFFEDRLTFGGNTAQPDTLWTSVTADYENFLEGADDDNALLFTLSSRQVNVIEWLIGKDKILIGTSGAEWTLGGSADEPLTPSNVKAEQHSTYGSANLQAILANESVLFFQRGAEKIRELAYNWELDSYIAPDMTILIPEITGDGITDIAFQQTPDSILWCVKENGDIAVFVYERKEQITSWSRLLTDDDFESIAIIHGDPEDEVWVSVARVIGGNTKRYIEYFSGRDFYRDDDGGDAFFVDSGITYDGIITATITGLTHLEGETVQVLANSVVLSPETVSGGQITIDTASAKVQVGLGYAIQMKTMPLSWGASGMTIQGRIKRINEVIVQYLRSGDFYLGKGVLNKELISVSGQGTDSKRVTFPAGYGRPGYVFVYQASPEPLTLIALMIEFMVY